VLLTRISARSGHTGARLAFDRRDLQVSLCAVLIVPQTVLLGLTFPLLSGAIIRRGPRRAAIIWPCSTSPIPSVRPPARSPPRSSCSVGRMPGTMRLAAR